MERVFSGLVIVVAVGALTIGLPARGMAQWAVNGTPDATDSTNRFPEIVADGAGGAIIVWLDRRADLFSNIYAHRLTSTGRSSPGWFVGGTSVCRAPGIQAAPALVADGTGGAIIGWQDYRGLPDLGIYAQHMTGVGRPDPRWPVDGLPLAAATTAYFHTMVSDDHGGAVVLSNRYDNGAELGLYAQRLGSNGQSPSAWPGGAVRIAPGGGRSCADGAGGAYVLSVDYRVDPRGDLYVQRVTGNGSIAPGWAENGNPIAGGPDYEWADSEPDITADGMGGAIIAWVDSRVRDEQRIRSLRIQADGSIAVGWPAGGVMMESSSSYYSDAQPRIAADGLGGAFVAWHAYNGRSDIRVQHVTAAGAIAATWPLDGLSLCSQEGSQTRPIIISDHAGGGVVAWTDYRNGGVFSEDADPDVYAQRFTAAGGIAAGWPVDGVALCRVSGDQINMRLSSDGAGGAIATWQDHRSERGGDIYAARVLERGFVPPRVTIEIDPDGSKRPLNLESNRRITATILGTPSFDAATVRPGSIHLAGAPAQFKGRSSLKDVNRDGFADLSLNFELQRMNVAPGDSLVALVGEMFDGVVIEGTARVYVAGKHSSGKKKPHLHDSDGQELELPGGLSMRIVSETPSRGHLAVSFSLMGSSPARLELLDVTGRRIFIREVGDFGFGSHSMDVVPDRTLAPGIYLMRLSQQSQVRLAKVVIVR